MTVLFQCPVCEGYEEELEELPPETGRPGGLMCHGCIEDVKAEVECTCYEAGPGHMPGCPQRERT